MGYHFTKHPQANLQEQEYKILGIAKFFFQFSVMEERRGRPKEQPPQEKLSKFIRVYEDEDMIETWVYNLDKHPNGPLSVDIKYKTGAENRIKQRAKETKQIKKTARQMKKINNKK